MFSAGGDGELVELIQLEEKPDKLSKEALTLKDIFNEIIEEGTDVSTVKPSRRDSLQVLLPESRCVCSEAGEQWDCYRWILRQA